MVSTAIDMVMALGTAIIEAAPNLTNAAFQCALAFGNALISYDWTSLGAQLLTALQGLIPTESATNIMQPILDGITASLPGLLSTGVEIISNLATGILNALPSLLETAGTLVIQFADFVLSNLPAIIDAGIQLGINLATGIVNALPKIVEVAQKLVLEAAATILRHMPEIVAAGATIPYKLATGIFQALPQIVSAAIKINTQIFDTVMSFDWGSLGSDIINGIVVGIQQMADAFITAILALCEGALGAVKKFFGIESPSKVMANEVGRYIPEGIALGIEQNADVVTDAMEDLSADTIKAADMMGITTKADFTGGSADSSAILARMDAMLTLMSRYFPEIAEQQKEMVTAGDFSINAINRSLGTMMA
jgi:phage-related protein